MQDFRIEIKIKNNKLYKLIFDNFSSVSEFCRKANIGTNQNEIGCYLNFTRKPYSYFTGIKKWKPLAQKVADYFNVFPEDIFEEKHYEKIKTNKLSCEVDEEKIGLYLENEIARLEAPDPIKQADLALKRDGIQYFLNCLTEKEREIIKMRYGFNDGSSYTLEEVGKKFGIVRERVRNIEAKALMKMKEWNDEHPRL